MTGEAKLYWILERGRPAPSLNAWSVLSPAELGKWEGMHILKRASEWLYGRWTAKHLLTSHGLPWEGKPFPSITISNAEEGAPLVAKTDIPGCLSISHRAEMAVAAFYTGDDRQVGIDLELIEPREDSFIHDWFTADEAAYAFSLEGDQRWTWVTMAWSAKEAVLKAWQKGLRLDTRSVELLPGEGGEEEDSWMRLVYRSNQPGFPMCWLGWQRLGDYVLTLAYTLLSGELEEGEVEISRVGR